MRVCAQVVVPAEVSEVACARDVSSPELDALLEGVRYGPRGQESQDARLYEAARQCLDALATIRPRRAGRDRIWSLWLQTRRGPIEAFGDFDEFEEASEVSSREEFEDLWRQEYPDEVQWRRLSVVAYDQRRFFLLGDLELGLDLDTGLFSRVDVEDTDGRELVAWLLDAAEREARRFALDPAAYNQAMVNDLSLAKRYGRIARSAIWRGAPEVLRFDRELGVTALRALRELVSATDSDTIIEQVTLAGYLGWCRICYEALGYEAISGVASAREMYTAMADGRHEGLLEIKPDDPETFTAWYRGRPGGGHPWEICRGGNRTHISLHVYPYKAAWQLRLAGFSQARAVETARMAVALAEHGVPFVLDQGEELVRMIAGEDDIGIVPDDILLGYNHADFPAGHRIHSFAHLQDLEALGPSLVEDVHWYPLEGLEPSHTSEAPTDPRHG